MRLFSCLLVMISLFSCNRSKGKPDVSNIHISTSVLRFEKQLFEADSNRIEPVLAKLKQDYPQFVGVFLTEIINADPSWNADTLFKYMNGFISAYRFVFDSAENVFQNFEPYQKEIEQGLRHVTYYFPAYPTPKKIVTYIGPLDGYGDILDDNALLVGLQHHLGNQFSGYQLPWVQQIYPGYISARFEPATVSVNALKNIVLDLYPEQTADRSLMIQMVEKGKRLYLLQSFLPNKKEHWLIGYSEKQLADCYAHEAVIWDLFVQNNFLQTIDYNIIKNYIGESPKTQALGEASPGNIGSFAGWQIVKKYMEKFPTTTVPAMMEMNPETIFEAAKYKP